VIGSEHAAAGVEGLPVQGFGVLQALLEAPSVKERAEALIALLEMANAGSIVRGPKQPLH